MYPVAIGQAPRSVARRDDGPAPFARFAGSVGLMVSDERIRLVFVVPVLAFLRKLAQGLPFFFAILRSEVRPSGHSAPRIPALCRRPSPV